MTIWYELWLNRIRPVTVTKVTEHFVTIGNRRYKRDGWLRFFPTWEDAKQALIKDAEDRVGAAQTELQQAMSALGNAKSLTQANPEANP